MPRATMPMPTAVVVDLAEPVRARFRRLAGSVSAQVRRVLRAKIVLAAADELPNAVSARDLKAASMWREIASSATLVGVMALLPDCGDGPAHLET